MMLQAWNGSDFTNDDLVRESSMIEDYEHKIVGEETIGGEPCWKIELMPKPDAPVVWGKIFFWIRHKDFLPTLLEYYDEKGRLIRSLVYSDFGVIGGRMLPKIWRMENRIKEGHKTEFVILDITFDTKISDRVTSLPRNGAFRELERGN